MTQAQTSRDWRIHAQYDNDPRLNGKRSLIRQHDEDGGTIVIAANISEQEHARLIAAAPELFDAAKDAHEWLANQGCIEGAYLDEASLIERLADAIAKATGQ